LDILCFFSNYTLDIPDGFSPNNDGRNDTYHIPNIMFTFPDYELEIFNRYGQSIAKLNKDNPEWNGENSKTGKVTTSGVYFYILNYNSNNLEPKQGRIYLSK
jgi:gliding motility-associated-like protein